MPLIDNVNYQPPFPYRNTHFNTIYTALLRPLFKLQYERERINTPDGDFLDLDWTRVGSDKLLICVHGLEGHARKPYMRGMMHLFNNKKDKNSDYPISWDAVGVNLRGCSGEDNRFLHGYHSGKSDDLDFVVEKIRLKKIYKQIVIIGFSIGGNIVLKYAGEKGSSIAPEVTHVLGYSVPCDLTACSIEFEKRKNIIYLNQFLFTLKAKAKKKHELFSGKFNLTKTLAARNFREFDTAYTAPINGFNDCFDYWENASCLPLIKNIAVPALMINAKDDTFLSPECFPCYQAQKNPFLFLETPTRGGHLGFMSPDTEGYLWTERRAWDFVNNKF